MVLTTLQDAIIDFCFNNFKNRYGRVCFVDWFPADWSKLEVHVALEDMLHRGIIYSPYYADCGFEEGFVLNTPSLPGKIESP